MYPVRRLSVLTVIQSTHIQKTGKSNGIEMFDSNKKKYNDRTNLFRMTLF